MSEQERHEPDRIEPEVTIREVDSADADSHNERMRTAGRTFRERIEGIPPGVRTVRAMRNRRRVIE
jgi:hypothetical protein